MRVVTALAISILLLSACDTTDSTRLVEYVADGRATQIDVAFIAPRGLPVESDTTFIRGDSTYTSGDTTFVLNVNPTWRFEFEAEDGDELFLRVINRTGQRHVSAIIYVDQNYFASDGSAEPFGAAQCGGTL